MPDVTEEAARLTKVWTGAVGRMSEAQTGAAIDRAAEEEQVAYDALIEYVEANGLNYSEWDPRGPDDPDYS
jgi:hypothetical protein